MEDDVTFYLTKAELLEISGRDWKEALKDLKEAGVLKDYEDAVALVFDKAKSIHIQSLLEFYGTRNVQSAPNKTGNPKDNE